MEYLKEYNEFVNEEINLRGIAIWTIGILIGIVAGISLLTIIILEYPHYYIKRLYSKYIKHDWETFARSIETIMDVMYSYSYYIDEIGDRKSELNEKDIKIIEKVEKKLIKKFGTKNPTGDTIKDYIKDELNKISKEEDREKINNLIDNYVLRKSIDNKKMKKMKTMIDVLGIKGEAKTPKITDVLDPFGEEEWDEEEIKTSVPIEEGEPYYYITLYPPCVGKGIIRMQDNKYIIGSMPFRFTKEDIRHLYQKHLKFGKDKTLYQLAKISHGVMMNRRNITSIIPTDQRDLFIDILKANWDNIIQTYKLHFKQGFREDKIRMLEFLKRTTPEELVDMLDMRYEINPGFVDISYPMNFLPNVNDQAVERRLDYNPGVLLPGAYRRGME